MSSDTSTPISPPSTSLSSSSTTSPNDDTLRRDRSSTMYSVEQSQQAVPANVQREVYKQFELLLLKKRSPNVEKVTIRQGLLVSIPQVEQVSSMSVAQVTHQIDVLSNVLVKMACGPNLHAVIEVLIKMCDSYLDDPHNMVSNDKKGRPDLPSYSKDDIESDVDISLPFTSGDNLSGIVLKDEQLRLLQQQQQHSQQQSSSTLNTPTSSSSLSSPALNATSTPNTGMNLSTGSLSTPPSSNNLNVSAGSDSLGGVATPTITMIIQQQETVLQPLNAYNTYKYVSEDTPLYLILHTMHMILLSHIGGGNSTAKVATGPGVGGDRHDAYPQDLAQADAARSQIASMSPKSITFFFNLLQYTFTPSVRCKAARCLQAISVVSLDVIAQLFVTRLQSGGGGGGSKADDFYREYSTMQRAAKYLEFGFYRATQAEGTSQYFAKLLLEMEKASRTCPVPDTFRSVITKMYDVVLKWHKKNAKLKNLCVRALVALCGTSEEMVQSKGADVLTLIAKGVGEGGSKTRRALLEALIAYFKALKALFGVEARASAFYQQHVDIVVPTVLPKKGSSPVSDPVLVLEVLLAMGRFSPSVCVSKHVLAVLAKEGSSKSSSEHALEGKAIVLKFFATLNDELGEQMRVYDRTIWQTLDPLFHAYDGDSSPLRYLLLCFPALCSLEHRKDVGDRITRWTWSADMEVATLATLGITNINWAWTRLRKRWHPKSQPGLAWRNNLAFLLLSLRLNNDAPEITAVEDQLLTEVLTCYFQEREGKTAEELGPVIAEISLFLHRSCYDTVFRFLEQERGRDLKRKRKEVFYTQEYVIVYISQLVARLTVIDYDNIPSVRTALREVTYFWITNPQIFQPLSPTVKNNIAKLFKHFLYLDSKSSIPKGEISLNKASYCKLLFASLQNLSENTISNPETIEGELELNLQKSFNIVVSVGCLDDFKKDIVPHLIRSLVLGQHIHQTIAETLASFLRRSPKYLNEYIDKSFDNDKSPTSSLSFLRALVICFTDYFLSWGHNCRPERLLMMKTNTSQEVPTIVTDEVGAALSIDDKGADMEELERKVMVLSSHLQIVPTDNVSNFVYHRSSLLYSNSMASKYQWMTPGLFEEVDACYHHLPMSHRLSMLTLLAPWTRNFYWMLSNSVGAGGTITASIANNFHHLETVLPPKSTEKDLAFEFQHQDVIQIPRFVPTLLVNGLLVSVSRRLVDNVLLSLVVQQPTIADAIKREAMQLIQQAPANLHDWTERERLQLVRVMVASLGETIVEIWEQLMLQFAIRSNQQSSAIPALDWYQSVRTTLATKKDGMDGLLGLCCGLWRACVMGDVEKMYKAVEVLSGIVAAAGQKCIHSETSYSIVVRLGSILLHTSYFSQFNASLVLLNRIVNSLDTNLPLQAKITEEMIDILGAGMRTETVVNRGIAHPHTALLTLWFAKSCIGFYDKHGRNSLLDPIVCSVVITTACMVTMSPEDPLTLDFFEYLSDSEEKCRSLASLMSLLHPFYPYITRTTSVPPCSAGELIRALAAQLFATYGSSPDLLSNIIRSVTEMVRSSMDSNKENDASFYLLLVEEMLNNHANNNQSAIYPQYLIEFVTVIIETDADSLNNLYSSLYLINTYIFAVPADSPLNIQMRRALENSYKDRLPSSHHLPSVLSHPYVLPNLKRHKSSLNLMHRMTVGPAATLGISSSSSTSSSSSSPSSPSTSFINMSNMVLPKKPTPAPPAPLKKTGGLNSSSGSLPTTPPPPVPTANHPTHQRIPSNSSSNTTTSASSPMMPTTPPPPVPLQSQHKRTPSASLPPPPVLQHKRMPSNNSSSTPTTPVTPSSPSVESVNGNNNGTTTSGSNSPAIGAPPIVPPKRKPKPSAVPPGLLPTPPSSPPPPPPSI
ncbi:hypothetical protein DFA_11361 [Cavenderia fasciculata]|uniref:Uncharacterized protein n=1 Tax=Cavenderia fasciculata TaxID=261658 RepID=F4QCG5_CACFS|nr:uncharacterized protein DFA_11361 [Cavenderia fasciculata]EGG13600.1 hypothetical protein DFA_11361 [Cavenderia fasciculata]|eukprot:XP_004350304.1 hypothetical protein DFA_11361 [Cavenderia fasciculata]